MASDSVCGAAFALISEPHLFQLFLEPVETAAANESDGAGREIQFVRNLLIWARRVLEEQHAYHPLASRTQVRERIAHHLLLLQFAKHSIRKRCVLRIDRNVFGVSFGRREKLFRLAPE